MVKGNGLGPWWFPAGLRRFLTRLGERFFNEAAWEKHDEGYARRYPSRAECDRKFLMAMLRDASRAETVRRAAACVLLAFFFWMAVRVGGSASYGRR